MSWLRTCTHTTPTVGHTPPKVTEPQDGQTPWGTQGASSSQIDSQVSGEFEKVIQRLRDHLQHSESTQPFFVAHGLSC